MAARSFDPVHRGARGVLDSAGTRFGTGRKVRRYRLDVVAQNVVDVVESAGGWLFDRAMAGWDVRVLVAEPGDTRPLRILGADTVPLESLMAPSGNGRPPHAIAVAAEFYTANERILEDVTRNLGNSDVEMSVWGEMWPAHLGARLDPVQHTLSVAARAFKAHALAAASMPDAPIAATEVFGAGVFSSHAFGADLVQLG